MVLVRVSNAAITALICPRVNETVDTHPPAAWEKFCPLGTIASLRFAFCGLATFSIFSRLAHTILSALSANKQKFAGPVCNISELKFYPLPARNIKRGFMPCYYMLSVRLMSNQNDWLDEYAARTDHSKSDVIRQAVSLMIEKDRKTQARIAREQTTGKAHDSQFA